MSDSDGCAWYGEMCHWNIGPTTKQSAPVDCQEYIGKQVNRLLGIWGHATAKADLGEAVTFGTSYLAMLDPRIPYGIEVRCPFMYFSTRAAMTSQPDL